MPVQPAPSLPRPCACPCTASVLTWVQSSLWLTSFRDHFPHRCPINLENAYVTQTWKGDMLNKESTCSTSRSQQYLFIEEAKLQRRAKNAISIFLTYKENFPVGKPHRRQFFNFRTQKWYCFQGGNLHLTMHALLHVNYYFRGFLNTACYMI